MALLRHGELETQLDQRGTALQARLDAFERALDEQPGTDGPDHDASVERRNEALVQLKDALWAVTKDRVPHARAVRALAGGDVPHQAAAAAFSSLQTALAALDRLEVRGRDSAGLSVLVSGCDPDTGELAALRQGREGDALFQTGSVRVADGVLDFVYTHAAEIGELGDNVAALRAAIQNDRLLQAALRSETVECLVLGHTRWASVGIISQANAHPLEQAETTGGAEPHVIGVLNGDVDNHHDLVVHHGLALHDAISTDAKVIPVLIARRMREGLDLADSFRRTVSEFEGSVASAAVTASDPDQRRRSARAR
jgi:glucosamine--fructose-6-phosphate aminotransferase (isomerizing)